MTDLLDEASWLYALSTNDQPAYGPVVSERTVGDLRRLLALAREAERLQKALEDIIEWTVNVPSSAAPIQLAHVGRKARAVLEGTDR